LSLLGAWAGYRLTVVLPEKLFFRTVEVALFLLAILLLQESLPPVIRMLHT